MTTTRRSTLVSSTIFVSGVLAALLLHGCSDSPQDDTSGPQPNAGIVLAIDTDAMIPSDIDGFAIEVTSGSVSPFAQDYDIGSPPLLPGTLTLRDSGVPHVGTIAPISVEIGSPGQTVTIVVTGLRNGASAMERRATLVLPISLKRLAITLEKACVGVVCPTDTTCHLGLCGSANVDSTALPDQMGNL